MPKRSTRYTRLALASLLLAAAMPAFAAEPVKIFHILGMPTMKEKEKGKLTIADGKMKISYGKISTADLMLSSIEDIDVGSGMTEAGGKVGQAAKVGSIAAPYGSGAALTLLLRSKVDMLTIVFRGPDGDMHGALFAVDKGQAEKIREQLVAAGAHPKERKM